MIVERVVQSLNQWAGSFYSVQCVYNLYILWMRWWFWVYMTYKTENNWNGLVKRMTKHSIQGYDNESESPSYTDPADDRKRIREEFLNRWINRCCANIILIPGVMHCTAPHRTPWYFDWIETWGIRGMSEKTLCVYQILSFIEIFSKISWLWYLCEPNPLSCQKKCINRIYLPL